MNEGRIVLIAVVAVALYLLFRDKWNRRRDDFLPRVRPPTSHTLQSLFVLAGVVALAWFVYWVMSTHCGGGC